MTGRARTNRTPRTLALALGLALVIGGCGSSSGSTPTNSICEHWCGNGSARVVVGGVTTSINGGGCYDTGAAGIDARFGDWVEGGIGDYLMVGGYRAGGPTPTPASTANLARPSATDHPSIALDASVGGQPLVLDASALVTFAANGTGSFSGTDLNGAGRVTGTFTCS
jgi:hypothetical protein